MMSIHIAEISDLELIAETERSIPEFTAPYSLEKLTSRLEGRRSLCLVARNSEDQVLGYKVGYAETSKRFYSWVGGVKPEARKQGVARKLLHYQEGWCQRNGFDQIQVWSENRYRGMADLFATRRL